MAKADSDKPKQRRGYVPTPAERKQVEAMAGYGLNHEQIAKLVAGGMSKHTLQRHFADELVTGKAKANLQVGKSIYQRAVDGDVTAAIWWSKTQMGWSDKRPESDTSDAPKKVQVTVVDARKKDADS